MQMQTRCSLTGAASTSGSHLPSQAFAPLALIGRSQAVPGGAGLAMRLFLCQPPPPSPTIDEGYRCLVDSCCPSRLSSWLAGYWESSHALDL